MIGEILKSIFPVILSIFLPSIINHPLTTYILSGFLLMLSLVYIQEIFKLEKDSSFRILSILLYLFLFVINYGNILQYVGEAATILSVLLPLTFFMGSFIITYFGSMLEFHLHKNKIDKFYILYLVIFMAVFPIIFLVGFTYNLKFSFTFLLEMAFLIFTSTAIFLYFLYKSDRNKIKENLSYAIFSLLTIIFIISLFYSINTALFPNVVLDIESIRKEIMTGNSIFFMDMNYSYYSFKNTHSYPCYVVLEIKNMNKSDSKISCKYTYLVMPNHTLNIRIKRILKINGSLYYLKDILLICGISGNIPIKENIIKVSVPKAYVTEIIGINKEEYHEITEKKLLRMCS